jgi:hypothetical protein
MHGSGCVRQTRLPVKELPTSGNPQLSRSFWVPAPQRDVPIFRAEIAPTLSSVLLLYSDSSPGLLCFFLSVCTPHPLQAEFLENWFQTQPPENDPTGAWTVAAADTESGNVLQSDVLFTRGGGWTGSIQRGEACYPILSPGCGVWARTGPRAFAVTFRSVLYNQDGSLAGIGKGRQTIILHASQEFSGRGHFTITLPDGTVQVPPDITFLGKRINVEPLP